MFRLRIPAIIYANVLLVAALERISPYYILATIWTESAFRWDAEGDGGHSFGLMQLYDQGAGAGHDRLYLLDISNNVRLGGAFLAVQLRRSPGDLRLGAARYRHPALESPNPWGPVDVAYVDRWEQCYNNLVGAIIEIAPDRGGRWPVEITEEGGPS